MNDMKSIVLSFAKKQQMTDLQNGILSGEYSFLDENEHLGRNIMLMTLGGSWSYGTNVEGSDVDIRGIALNRPSDLIGLTNFEQVVHESTDTTIYAFNKVINLLLNCNPNVIEMLGCKPDHYVYLSDAGKALLDNRKLFLSQKAIRSFGGYAMQQLHRLENAIARDKLPQEKKEQHMLESILNAMEIFSDRYTDLPEGSLRAYVGKSSKDNMDSEVMVDVSLHGYPMRDFTSVIQDMKTIVRDYDKLNGRNHKKDDAHLNKHAMHLVRLYLTCTDLMEQGDIITYREKDHDLLMSIRNGAFMNPDGTFRPDFFDMIEDLRQKTEYAKEHTVLPKLPDFNKVQEFVMEINKKVLEDLL